MFLEKDKCNDACDSLINISSLIDSKCFLKRISDVCDSLINISSLIDSKCFLKRINAMILVVL